MWTCVYTAISGRLFDWLVTKINSSVQGKQGLFIGALDVSQITIAHFLVAYENGYSYVCTTPCLLLTSLHLTRAGADLRFRDL